MGAWEMSMVFSLELAVKTPGGDTVSVPTGILGLETGLTILAPNLGFSLPLLGTLGILVWGMVCLLLVVVVLGTTFTYPDHLGFDTSSLSLPDTFLLGVVLLLPGLEGDLVSVVVPVQGLDGEEAALTLPCGGNRTGLLGVLGLGMLVWNH